MDVQRNQVTAYGKSQFIEEIGSAEAMDKVGNMVDDQQRKESYEWQKEYGHRKILRKWKRDCRRIGRKQPMAIVIAASDRW